MSPVAADSASAESALPASVEELVLDRGVVVEAEDDVVDEALAPAARVVDGFDEEPQPATVATTAIMASAPA
jgi:hypothetical protein